MPSIRIFCSQGVYQKTDPQLRKALGDELRQIVATYRRVDREQVETLWFPFADSQGADDLSLDVAFSASGSIYKPEADYGAMTQELREHLLATKLLPWNIIIGVALTISFQGTYLGGARIKRASERRD